MLDTQLVEGEIGLVIDYVPGKSVAVDVLAAAMQMIESLDKLDAALLSSIDTSLEPVSILNDVRHSSLKVLLARALRKMPDDHLATLEWKKWIGGLLVKGKYVLLNRLDADAPEIKTILVELENDYKAAPGGLIGYSAPRVSDVRDAMDSVMNAKAKLYGQRVSIQTELGDVIIPDRDLLVNPQVNTSTAHTITNTGVELFKIKSPDMLGTAQWQVIRNNRTTRVDMLHKKWLDDYHARKFTLLPGDSVQGEFEETVTYDSNGNEIDRKLAIVEVQRIITPPSQQRLLLPLPTS